MVEPTIAEAATSGGNDGDEEPVDLEPPEADETPGVEAEETDLHQAEEAADEVLDELTDATERAADDDAGASDEEVEEALAEPVMDEGGGSDFFDAGTEEPDDPFASSGTTGTTASEDPFAEMEEGAPDLAGGSGDGLADTINSGFARLSVVGLEDHHGKDDLREEFKEVFQEFKLGNYGEQVCQEYLFIEDDDIDPIWGFAGALVICLAFVVYMRPDGDDIMDSVMSKLSNLGR